MDKIQKEFNQNKYIFLEVCATKMNDLFVKTLIIDNENYKDRQWMVYTDYSYVKQKNVVLFKRSYTKRNILIFCTNRLTGENRWIDLKKLCRLNKINYTNILNYMIDDS